MTGDCYRLTKDVISIFPDKRSKPKIYGYRGNIVTEISQSDPVVIVQGKDGERYPALKNILQPI